MALFPQALSSLTCDLPALRHVRWLLPGVRTSHPTPAPRDSDGQCVSSHSHGEELGSKNQVRQVTESHHLRTHVAELECQEPYQFYQLSAYSSEAFQGRGQEYIYAPVILRNLTRNSKGGSWNRKTASVKQHLYGLSFPFANTSRQNLDLRHSKAPHWSLWVRGKQEYMKFSK